MYFCEESCGKLHQFSTFETDTNVRTIAKDLNDTSLLTKIQGGDLIALESKYHLSCLAKLRNRHRSYLRETDEEISSTMNEERKMEAITSVFSQVALQPYTHVHAKSPHFGMLERYTVLLYNKSSTMEHVNEARMELL